MPRTLPRAALAAAALVATVGVGTLPAGAQLPPLPLPLPPVELPDTGELLPGLPDVGSILQPVLEVATPICDGGSYTIPVRVSNPAGLPLSIVNAQLASNEGLQALPIPLQIPAGDVVDATVTLGGDQAGTFPITVDYAILGVLSGTVSASVTVTGLCAETGTDPGAGGGGGTGTVTDVEPGAGGGGGGGGTGAGGRPSGGGAAPARAVGARPAFTG